MRRTSIGREPGIDELRDLPVQRQAEEHAAHQRVGAAEEVDAGLPRRQHALETGPRSPAQLLGGDAGTAAATGSGGSPRLFGDELLHAPARLPLRLVGAHQCAVADVERRIDCGASGGGQLQDVVVCGGRVVLERAEAKQDAARHFLRRQPVADERQADAMRLVGDDLLQMPRQRRIDLDEVHPRRLPVANLRACLLLVADLQERIAPVRHQPFEDLAGVEVARRGQRRVRAALVERRHQIERGACVAHRGDAESDERILVGLLVGPRRMHVRIEQAGNREPATGIEPHSVWRDLLALLRTDPLDASVLDEHRCGVAKPSGREIEHAYALDEQRRRHVAGQAPHGTESPCANHQLPAGATPSRRTSRSTLTNQA